MISVQRERCEHFSPSLVMSVSAETAARRVWEARGELRTLEIREVETVIAACF